MDMEGDKLLTWWRRRRRVNERQIESNLWKWAVGFFMALTLTLWRDYKKYLIPHFQMNTLNPLLLNNTRHAENQIIFFNRVPKVGSQTFMELLRRLSIRNNFLFHRDAVQRVETIRLSPYQQEEMAEMISELPTPSGNNINNENAML